MAVSMRWRMASFRRQFTWIRKPPNFSFTCSISNLGPPAASNSATSGSRSSQSRHRMSNQPSPCSKPRGMAVQRMSPLVWNQVGRSGRQALWRSCLVPYGRLPSIGRKGVALRAPAFLVRIRSPIASGAYPDKRQQRGLRASFPTTPEALAQPPEIASSPSCQMRFQDSLPARPIRIWDIPLCSNVNRPFLGLLGLARTPQSCPRMPARTWNQRQLQQSS
jgi:hypothetical protein